MSDIYITKEKEAELREQLHELKTVQRIQIAERLKKAKEFGDLSENFEYSQAKEDQEQLERDIARLEATLKDAHIITKSRNKDVVSVGLSVVLKKEGGEKVEFTIVGSQDADPSENRISNVSPLGKALIGKKVGEKATILTPKKKEVTYTILKIS